MLNVSDQPERASGEEPAIRGTTSARPSLGRVLRLSQAWITSTDGTLQTRVLRGGIWLVAADAAAQGAGLLKLALIGRLLSPADFGLLGIALFVQRLVESFTDTGVMAALIQKRGDIRRYLDAAWTLQTIRGIAVCLIVLAIAPVGARFFGDRSAAPVIGSISIATLLWAVINPAVVYLRRDLQFQADVVWRLYGIGASLVVAVPAALYFRSVWALVLAVIVNRLVDVVASYRVHPFRPRVALRWAEMSELLQFGRWISISNMMTFGESQVDSLVVGKMLGAPPLGIYQVAAQFASPFQRLGTHIQGVLFPAMSKMDELQARRRVLVSSLTFLATALVPLALFVSVVAEPLVRVVIGPSWGPVAPILQALAFAAVARTLCSCTAPLLMSAGEPNKVAYSQTARFVALAVLLYPCVARYGARGAGWAVAVSSVFGMTLQLVMCARALSLRWMELLRALWPAAIASIPLVGALLATASMPSARVGFGAIALPVYAVTLSRVFRVVIRNATDRSKSSQIYVPVA